MKSLIIAEKKSSAVAFCKTLNVRQLHTDYVESDDYIITWCQCPLVRLSHPESYAEKLKKWTMKDLPFIPKEYMYELLPNKYIEKKFYSIKKLVHRNDISTIYYTPSPTIEGIGTLMDIRLLANIPSNIYEKVIWIHENTAEKIKEGILTAKELKVFSPLYNAYAISSIDNYAIRTNFSRALTLKYGSTILQASGKKKGTISVERTLIYALGMIVKKEKEIKSYNEASQQTIYLVLNNGIQLEWRNTFNKEDNIESILDYLNRSLNGGEALSIQKYNVREIKKDPPLLFNLTELQNECLERLKISPSKTMELLQRLYEANVITYPITDSQVISSDMANSIESHLLGLKRIPKYEKIINKILSDSSYKNLKNTNYVNKKNMAQNIAIIPTGETSVLHKLDKLSLCIYDLICRRFFSIMLNSAVYEEIELELALETASNKEIFSGKITVLKEANYLTLYNTKTPSKNIENNIKEILDMSPSLVIKRGCAPKRYTASSLVLAIDSIKENTPLINVGTSKTRCSIIDKLIQNDYAQLDNETQIITPTNFGHMVYEVIQLTIPSLLNSKSVIAWEKGLLAIKKNLLSKELYLEKLNTYISTETKNIINHDYTAEVSKRIQPYINKRTEEKNEN